MAPPGRVIFADCTGGGARLLLVPLLATVAITGRAMAGVSDANPLE